MLSLLSAIVIKPFWPAQLSAYSAGFWLPWWRVLDNVENTLKPFRRRAIRRDSTLESLQKSQQLSSQILRRGTVYNTNNTRSSFRFRIDYPRGHTRFMMKKKIG
jgi:hypothetical protein